MGKRQREWAVRAREALIQWLGGKCVLCGSQDQLQIDHPFGRDWSPRKIESSQRISRYRQEARLGLVRVLCWTCNDDPANKPSAKRDSPGPRPQPAPPQPF
jgi:5-methylcytosine-specific restriction endonuclease McrA